MKLLDRISIKNILMGTIALLVAMLAVQSVINFRNNYRYNNEVARMDMANELSDFIIVAAGQEVAELSAGLKANVEMFKIDLSRRDEDQAAPVRPDNIVELKRLEPGTLEVQRSASE